MGRNLAEVYGRPEAASKADPGFHRLLCRRRSASTSIVVGFKVKEAAGIGRSTDRMGLNPPAGGLWPDLHFRSAGD